MLVLKQNPVGIDLTIDRIQKRIYDLLDWTDYESYHRVYVNETPQGLVPELFYGDRDYCEVFFDDNFNATSYSIVNSPVDVENLSTYSVDWYFQVKLDEIYPSVDHRADEECHEDVLNAFRKATVGNRQINSLVFGLRNVYRNFYIDEARYTDMQGFHVFKFNLELIKDNSCRTL